MPEYDNPWLSAETIDPHALFEVMEGLPSTLIVLDNINADSWTSPLQAGVTRLRKKREPANFPGSGQKTRTDRE